MRLRTLAPLAALALLPLVLPAQGVATASLPLKRRATPTVAAITPADLMSRLYVFADDSMMGREAGLPSHMKGTAWIAAELKRMGLEPGGDNGSYFQNVPFVARTLAPSTRLAVGNRPLAPYVDFVAVPFRGLSARPVDRATAIYGGVMGDTAHMLTADQATGRIVVVHVPANVSTRITATSPLAGAAALAVIADSQITPALVKAGHGSTLTLRPVADDPASPSTMYITPSAAEALLGVPLESVTLGTTGAAMRGNLDFDLTAAPTRNVIGIVRGSDRKLRKEYVAVGAHSDHIGLRAAGPVDHDSLHLAASQRWLASENPTGAKLTPEAQAQLRTRLASIRVNVDSLHRLRPARRDSINNGADDDGSGTVTVLEVAEAFARSRVKPARSLLFVWHTGEEKGLLGSRYYADHPTVPRDAIVAQVNIDMVGRGASTDLAAGSDRYLQLVGSRRLSTELGDLVERLNKAETVPFTFDYAFDANGHPENIYCRSDHYNYARYGIPVVFLTTGLHGDYHQVTDEAQYIDYPHMARVGMFVERMVRSVASLDHRPVVDKPKPDPKGVCKQ
ncbi:MAG: M28 family peptidase [Gemmatimonadaceae bacterium]|nr:M28 family peptidase [Gemmatimonadaceae bacterium]